MTPSNFTVAEGIIVLPSSSMPRSAGSFFEGALKIMNCVLAELMIKSCSWQKALVLLKFSVRRLTTFSTLISDSLSVISSANCVVSEQFASGS